MSMFHSMVSRREFMKALGFGAVGVGAASMIGPTFHDLDELSQSGGSWKRPWWVKHDDKPTVEIDWSQVKRIDQRLTTQSQWVNAQYEGVDKWKQLRADGTTEGTKRPGRKGNALRDYALNAGADAFETPVRVWTHGTLLGPKVKTPDQIGLPKWTGTPEEAASMLRAASVYYGAAQIGACEMGADEKKLVFTYGKTEGGWSGGAVGVQGGGANDVYFIDHWPPPLTAGKKFDFVNQDVGYEDSEHIYLPDRQLWDVGVMIPMSRDAWRTDDPVDGSQVRGSANISRYRIWTMSVMPGMLAFLTTLGYHGYGYPYPCKAGGLVPSLASAVLGGISEMGRSSEVGINPEYGSVGGYYSVLTDLPVAPDKPIDAGIFRFCHTCHKCANACPSKSISQDSEPGWEIPQFDYKVAAMNMQGGKKVFWTDTHSCARYRLSYPCCICRPTCTFNTNSGAMIHEVVKPIVSTTSMFNSVFWNASKPFGFGLHDNEGWWSASLPSWGTDSTLVAYDGGYKK
jgi:epoxyqueuosine reductase